MSESKTLWYNLLAYSIEPAKQQLLVALVPTTVPDIAAAQRQCTILCLYGLRIHLEALCDVQALLDSWLVYLPLPVKGPTPEAPETKQLPSARAAPKPLLDQALDAATVRDIPSMSLLTHVSDNSQAGGPSLAVGEVHLCAGNESQSLHTLLTQKGWAYNFLN